jgi:hypothetical protein
VIVSYYPQTRDAALQRLGTAWPPEPGATVVRLPPDAPITDGAVILRPADDQPGITWRAVDSLIVTQPAGSADEALAALIPGSALETIPGPDEPPAPPVPTTSDSAAAAADAAP